MAQPVRVEDDGDISWTVSIPGGSVRREDEPRSKESAWRSTCFPSTVLPKTRPEAWGFESEEEVQQAFADTEALNAELQEVGVWVFGGGLQPVSSATVVDNTNGDLTMTDGPYAETKEYLGGFWVIDVSDLDCAARVGDQGVRRMQGDDRGASVPGGAPAVATRAWQAPARCVRCDATSQGGAMALFGRRHREAEPAPANEELAEAAASLGLHPVDETGFDSGLLDRIKEASRVLHGFTPRLTTNIHAGMPNMFLNDVFSGTIDGRQVTVANVRTPMEAMSLEYTAKVHSTSLVVLELTTMVPYAVEPRSRHQVFHGLPRCRPATPRSTQRSAWSASSPWANHPLPVPRSVNASQRMTTGSSRSTVRCSRASVGPTSRQPTSSPIASMRPSAS